MRVGAEVRGRARAVRPPPSWRLSDRRKRARRPRATAAAAGPCPRPRRPHSAAPRTEQTPSRRRSQNTLRHGVHAPGSSFVRKTRVTWSRRCTTHRYDVTLRRNARYLHACYQVPYEFGTPTNNCHCRRTIICRIRVFRSSQEKGGSVTI